MKKLLPILLVVIGVILAGASLPAHAADAEHLVRTDRVTTVEADHRVAEVTFQPQANAYFVGLTDWSFAEASWPIAIGVKDYPTGLSIATSDDRIGIVLGVDLDRDGDVDGRLFYEPRYYGENLWLDADAPFRFRQLAPHKADVASGNNDGQGSGWYGTLDEWVDALAGYNWNAEFVTLGFSAGVKGTEGTVSSVTFDRTRYSFGPALAKPPVKPTPKPPVKVAPRVVATPSIWSVTDQKVKAEIFGVSPTDDAARGSVGWSLKVKVKGKLRTVARGRVSDGERNVATYRNTSKKNRKVVLFVGGKRFASITSYSR